MGRTQTSITQVFDEYSKSLTRFRRALRRSDQLLLDELFGKTRQNLAAIAHAAHLLPYEIFLLAMLLETYKELRSLRIALEEDLLPASPPPLQSLQASEEDPWS